VQICVIQTDPSLARENLRPLAQAIATLDADAYVLPELFMMSHIHSPGVHARCELMGRAEHENSRSTTPAHRPSDAAGVLSAHRSYRHRRP
jgi:hypothetical protein